MAAADHLHPEVQRWIYHQGWTGLRPIQELAIAPILGGQQDLIIAAATAGGKTEAAFLPIFSHLLNHPGASIRVLGLSPLKALINDQHRRLLDMGESMGISVTAWHGDVASHRKHRLLQDPQGIVIITPESLEALIARRGPALGRLFQRLNYIVIDEMHVFIGSERGRQLQSLMHRLEYCLDRSIPRIGLSATLGDMDLAAEFLRPGHGRQVQVINPAGPGGQLRLQLRGYQRSLSDQAAVELAASQALHSEASADDLAMAQHLFQALRGSNNLIFVNGRARVEQMADLLRLFSEQARVPNEFYPHHGSLAKHLREEVEDLLRSDLPANVVCTTTLEMGIDVGDVQSIAQVGSPLSVASIRQRLGRSGRRAGEPAIARFYVSVPELAADMPPQEAIHPELVQTIAMINLLLERWCEPPVPEKLQLSTLIQQLLSLLSQYEGLKAQDLWEILGETGPFQQVSAELFQDLLRCLGQREMIQQSGDRTLLLSPKGERIVNHYSFYSAFQTPEDYELVHLGRTLGTLPQRIPLVPQMRIVFAGQSWQVEAVDEARKIIEVSSAPGGRVPRFSGGGGGIHSHVRQAMYHLYCSQDQPPYLDPMAQRLLAEAREQFRAFHLHRTSVLGFASQSLIFCWQGDRVLNTLLVLLLAKGLKAAKEGIAIAVRQCDPPTLVAQLGQWADEPMSAPLDLARSVKNKRLDKYDYLLSEDLLCHNYALSEFDVPLTWQTLRDLSSQDLP
ncbi:DEAD/DEAH box helicase [Lyngbya confervoides]|uniref:DEAD/DEAH box helicase n=1 Tax=Lyngbya confervoides BDU141951 TaxID=1574623 RepID=A0ABD4SZ36_9CYAN|nr:DEAD/DEAH box helicase [Lyngbya confervoides]MCM1981654.1 DEAD/DEAH box helicase [Lyngbya confervoides BDU141951]